MMGRDLHDADRAMVPKKKEKERTSKFGEKLYNQATLLGRVQNSVM